MFRIGYACALGCCSAALALGCSSSDSMGGVAAPPAASDVDFDAQASDFTCILDWQKVRSFYITNKAGKMTEALAVANSANGGTYPVGTIIQLIPLEAMVKRKAGFNAATKDWEFFSLQPSATGTQILKRGTTDVVNQFMGNCFNCHQKAAPQFDMVCEKTHGCDPLPFTDAQIQSVQNADPRCHD